jgi:hypothetical protein
LHVAVLAGLSYDAGLGNAATQARESRVADCVAERATPANEPECDAMATRYGID